MLDIFVPIAVMNRQLRFVGKKELKKVPLFGLVFSHLDVSIDRESSTGAYSSLEQAAELLRQGIDVVVAPEGTTSAKAPELLPFKNGPFWLAERTQAPVVPLVFLDNWRLFHYDKKWSGRPGVSRVRVLPAVTGSKPEGIKSEVRDVMENALREIRHHEQT
jgi:1-acyl-sn-glycerol-3-phosphate acyltransferase